jgi:hypothetical protein
MDHGHAIEPMIYFEHPLVGRLDLADPGSCAVEDSGSPLRDLSNNLEFNRGSLFIARVKLSPLVLRKEG